ncbi:MAG: hypothetical protein J6Z82_05965 [Schwartzia sp.]|nr:hypothetical protein [Schwartzia sp. (in: firmicutes)]
MDGKKDGAGTADMTVFYDEDGIRLADVDGELYLSEGTRAYKIGSHPYEPCIYLLRDGEICATIHNAFDQREIYNLAKRGGSLRSVTGNAYDLPRLCRLLAFAAAHFTDVTIDYAEGRIAIEKLKELGALSPETAVPAETLGLRKISGAFSHSKKLNERVMYREDGKVWLRIKKT